MVNKRVVRIPLECILVYFDFSPKWFQTLSLISTKHVMGLFFHGNYMMVSSTQWFFNTGLSHLKKRVLCLIKHLNFSKWFIVENVFLFRPKKSKVGFYENYTTFKNKISVDRNFNIWQSFPIPSVSCMSSSLHENDAGSALSVPWLCEQTPTHVGKTWQFYSS